MEIQKTGMGTVGGDKVSVPQALQQAGKTAVDAASLEALNALKEAVVNAARPGAKTSEFKIAWGGIVLTGLLAGLHALSVIPGPWTVPALAISAAMSVGGYAFGRARVKVAALQAASAALPPNGKLL